MDGPAELGLSLSASGSGGCCCGTSPSLSSPVCDTHTQSKTDCVYVCICIFLTCCLLFIYFLTVFLQVQQLVIRWVCVICTFIFLFSQIFSPFSFFSVTIFFLFFFALVYLITHKRSKEQWKEKKRKTDIFIKLLLAKQMCLAQQSIQLMFLIVNTVRVDSFKKRNKKVLILSHTSLKTFSCAVSFI